MPRQAKLAARSAAARLFESIIQKVLFGQSVPRARVGLSRARTPESRKGHPGRTSEDSRGLPPRAPTHMTNDEQPDTEATPGRKSRLPATAPSSDAGHGIAPRRYRHSCKASPTPRKCRLAPRSAIDPSQARPSSPLPRIVILTRARDRRRLHGFRLTQPPRPTHADRPQAISLSSTRPARHAPVKGHFDDFLRGPEMRTQLFVDGRPVPAQPGPSARAALSSTPSPGSVSMPAARSLAENVQRPSAIGRLGLPAAFRGRAQIVRHLPPARLQGFGYGLHGRTD